MAAMLSVGEEMYGEFLLISSSILFSMSFVGSRFAMVNTRATIGPWTFNALRYSVSFLVLFILEPTLRKHPIFKFPEPDPERLAEDSAKLASTASHSPLSSSRSANGVASAGASESTLSLKRISRKMMYIILVQGSSNFIASILLQIGLQTLDASKAAFITSCYVVVIPFVECLMPLITGDKFECLSGKIWIEVIICIVGVYLISGCMGTVSCFGSTQDAGEIYVVGSVLFWVVNIMICDEAGKYHDSILLTLGDFAVVSLLTIVFSVWFEGGSWVYPFTNIIDSWPVILFVGFFEAFAYLLSTVGQIYVRPSRAAIIYSGESLFTSLGGYLFLGETLTPSEILGGGLICLSSMLTSLSFASDEEEEEEEELEKMESKVLELEEQRPLHDFKDLSPLLPQRHLKQQLLQQLRQQEQQELQYLPPYMQMRRQRGGSITRYPLFRSKPAAHFECTRPVAVPSPSMSMYGSTRDVTVSLSGSLPTESNMSRYSLEMQQLASSL
jgi:drug/metabolite transporter (DMT)-like permease